MCTAVGLLLSFGITFDSRLYIFLDEVLVESRGLALSVIYRLQSEAFEEPDQALQDSGGLTKLL